MRAPERQAGFEGNLLDDFHGRFADSAHRRVDDAQQRNRIIRILDDFQIRNHVLDLGALVERKAAHDVILQLIAAHGLFKQTRLRVGAIEDGGARCLAIAILGGFAQIFGDEVGGEEGFVLAVRSFVVADLRARPGARSRDSCLCA